MHIASASALTLSLYTTLWASSGCTLKEKAAPAALPDAGSEQQFLSVDVDFASVCGLTIEGSIHCFNRVSETNSRTSTGAVFSAVRMNAWGVCGLQDRGQVRCMLKPGWNETEFQDFVQPEGLFKSIDGGGGLYFCGIKTDDTLGCWGKGIPYTADTEGGKYSEVAVGRNHLCAVEAETGLPRCWGSENQIYPPEGQQLVGLDAGEGHTCGIEESTGAVHCWGDNQWHDLVPPVLSAVTELAVGDGHACALKAGGDTVCWGRDGRGQGQMPKGALSEVAAGYQTTCAIGSEGQLVCAGRLSAVIDNESY